MRLLVAGAARVDAGKTTFSTGLIARTDAVGFKPRAGNSYWYDHDDVRSALADGRLYGKDARRLAAASPGDLAPESINPVHRLWHPAPGPGTGLLGQDDREFLLDRVGDEYVRNGTRSLPDAVRAALELETTTTVSDLASFNEAMATRHVSAMDAIAADIDSVDRAVVESYGDVARPLRNLAPDAVAVVEPARARLYDGERYRKACSVVSGGPTEGQLEERVESVVDLIDAESVTDLPALESDERGDPAAVASAYARSYDALLALVD